MSLPQPVILIPTAFLDYRSSGRYLVSINGVLREASYDPTETAFRLLAEPDKKIPVPDIQACAYIGPSDNQPQ